MLLIIGSSGGVGSRLTEIATGDPSFPAVYGASRSDFDIEDETATADFFDSIPGLDADPSHPLYVVNATGKNISGYVRKQSASDFASVVAANLSGSFNILKHFARVARGRPGSSVLFMSSVVVKRAIVPGATAYAAAKAGLEGLVRASAQELARDRLRVNCVRMGYYDAGMMNTIPVVPQKKIFDQIPLSRWGQVIDLWWTCSAILRSKYMTGAIVDVNGGLA